MLKGFITGTISTFFTLPFQVLNTNMITMNNKNRTISLKNMIKTIYNKEGLKGFYRGLIPNLLRIPIGDAIFFSTLELSQRILKNHLHLNKTLCYMISSSLGMTFECIVVNPILVIATRSEKLESKQNNNVFKAFHSIIKNEGFKGYLLDLNLYYLKKSKVGQSFIFYIKE